MLITSAGGGRPSLMPIGTWKVRAQVRNGASKAGNQQLIVTFVGLEGDAANTEAVDFYPITEASDWKLGILYTALTGDEYPGAGEVWDSDDLTGLECMIEVEHQEYEGKVSARPARMFPA